MDREVERREEMLEIKREMEAENEAARMKEELTSLIKRRKIHDSEIGDLPENLLLEGDSLENSTSTLVINGEMTCDYVKSTDLKGGEDSETVGSTFMSGELSRETSPSGEISGGEESGEEAMDSPSSSTTRKRKSSPLKCCVAKTPSTAEIDEFFSAAERSEQQRFAKKYNYDIVKDVPMEGRYQWIPLKSFN